MARLPELKDVEAAAGRISSLARVTPLEKSRWLSTEAGREVFFKLECHQLTGSFKLRGAMARLSTLTSEERARGVLTVSAGNHGVAVACCSEALDLDTIVIVPKSASRAKIAAIKRYPVEVIELGDNWDAAEAAALQLAVQTGRIFVSPYNDPEVIAGQGTVALEILREEPAIDAIVVPVGGGGLLAGVALAAKSLKRMIKVYGAEPINSPTMSRALEAGRIVQIAEEPTVADGLSGNIEAGSITFPLCQQFVDGIVLVSEDAISAAMTRVAREDHVMIEPSAAVALAAVFDGAIEGNHLAVVLTGRNVSFDDYIRMAGGARQPG